MTAQQWRMLSSLLLMVITVASIVLTYRKARKRPESNSLKKQKPTVLGQPITLLSPAVRDGADPMNDEVIGEEEYEHSEGTTTTSPHAIRQDLDARSPDQLSELNEIYRGRQIKWLVLFKERQPETDRGLLKLRFLEENTILNVTCETNINQFPDVENWMTNDKIWICGTITRISDTSIRLSDVELERKQKKAFD